MMMAGLVDGNLGFGEWKHLVGGRGGCDDSIVLLSSSHN